MSGLNKNRTRNQTVCFRMTPEERCQLEARIKVCGMAKGQYFIQSLLHQKIEITIDKYQSDRLSLELKRFRKLLEELENHDRDQELAEILNDCKAFLGQLVMIINCGDSTAIQSNGF